MLRTAATLALTVLLGLVAAAGTAAAGSTDSARSPMIPEADAGPFPLSIAVGPAGPASPLSVAAGPSDPASEPPPRTVSVPGARARSIPDPMDPACRPGCAELDARDEAIGAEVRDLLQRSPQAAEIVLACVAGAQADGSIPPAEKQTAAMACAFFVCLFRADECKTLFTTLFELVRERTDLRRVRERCGCIARMRRDNPRDIPVGPEPLQPESVPVGPQD